jgi:hypothetical protein
MKEYRYQPLGNEGSPIRLMNLHAGSLDSTLTCSLRVAYMDDPSYHPQDFPPLRSIVLCMGTGVFQNDTLCERRSWPLLHADETEPGVSIAKFAERR